MRRLFCCKGPRWGFSLAGLAAAALALGAYPLGLDNNPVMGPRRVTLLLAGIGTLLLVHRRRLSSWLQRDRPEPLDVGRAPQDRGRAEPRDAHLGGPPIAVRWASLCLISAATLVVYGWLVTAGKPTDLPETTFYYDMLADAFASGQMHLRVTPDPRLAESPNPYDPSQRSEIPICRAREISGCFLNDASYYQGKYYLYWGPTPALVMTLLKIWGLGTIGDDTIALIGAIGLFFSLACCIAGLWRSFFRQLPWWLLMPPLVLAGLAYPLPWVLDAPHVYEAAILWGSALLTAGLAVAIPVLVSGSPRSGRLASAGLFWGLALGSRITLALPIAVLATALGWRIVRLRSGRRGWKTPVLALVAMGLPIAASVALTGAYNYARFSDPVEWGHRYQLQAGALPLQSSGFHEAFKWKFLPANAYNYMLAPFSVTQEFPFLEPRLPSATVSFGRIGPVRLRDSALPSHYPMSGLLVSTPFSFFTLYLIWWLVCSQANCAGNAPAAISVLTFERPGFRALVLALFLAGSLGVLPILTYYVAAARYLLDVMPFATILASLGSWAAYAHHARTSLARRVLGPTIVVTAGASAVVSVLLALNNWSR